MDPNGIKWLWHVLYCIDYDIADALQTLHTVSFRSKKSNHAEELIASWCLFAIQEYRLSTVVEAAAGCYELLLAVIPMWNDVKRLKEENIIYTYNYSYIYIYVYIYIPQGSKHYYFKGR